MLSPIPILQSRPKKFLNMVSTDDHVDVDLCFQSKT
jgi:hypothetical protein